MPLTNRTNGTLAQNLITADWFNDYFKLVTGVMYDQPITVLGDVTLKGQGVAPVSAPTGVASAGTGLTAGNYKYAITFATADGGESPSSPQSGTITVSGGNLQITLSSIPLGPNGTTRRNIYRTSSGGVTVKYTTYINDNTSTTFVDSVPDASQITSRFPPTYNTLGGSLFLYDSLGVLQMTLASDGSIVIPNGTITAQNMTILQNGTLTITNTGGSLIVFGSGSSGYLGIKKADGLKCFEVNNAGDLIIKGTYKTTTGGASITTGASFDTFDVAEVFETDKTYDNGVVVCPGPDGKMRQCIHDNCFAASVISHCPGLMFGTEEEVNSTTTQAVALTGRVNAKTASNIGFRVLVCSDGNGGVRPIEPDVPSFTLGFTLNSSQNGMVGIMLRPMFCTKG